MHSVSMEQEETLQDTRSEYDKGSTAGLWYAISLLAIIYNASHVAIAILNESGILKWEFEEALKETNFLGAPHFYV
jgi:hypothetical protein